MLLCDYSNSVIAQYTMFGPDGLTSPAAAKSKVDSDSRGLVYRACSEILFAASYRKRMGIDTNIGVSYVEVFGDTVTDLLRNGYIYHRCKHFIAY